MRETRRPMYHLFFYNADKGPRQDSKLKKTLILCV